MALYLIPVVFNTGGKLPLEYRIISRKKDMRYNFCKNNIANEIDTLQLLQLVARFSPVVKDGRVIMKSGEMASIFSKALKKMKGETA